MEANRLYEIIQERNLTYRQLARMSGVSYSAIQKIASFERSPKQDTMIAIAKALELPVTEVFNLNY